jgi:hypothetical protein
MQVGQNAPKASDAKIYVGALTQSQNPHHLK